MSVSDETLLAFVDGELQGPEREAVERALAGDAALRAKLAAHQRLRTLLSKTYDDALTEPVPDRLLAAARGAGRSAEIVDLGARRAAVRWSVREWGAMAASLAAGLVIAFGMSGRDSSPFAIARGALVARGELARALDTRLTADAGGSVHIGLSFQDKDGQYCRTFNSESTAGLACRDDGAWRVVIAAAPATAGGEVRTAGSDMPPAVLSAVEALIQGDALDAHAEAAARDRGWRAGPAHNRQE